MRLPNSETTQAYSAKRASLLVISVMAICSFLGVAAWAGVDPAAVSSDEIMRHIKYLASDDLQGRRSGTPGCERAADYIAAQYKKYGLKPSGKDSFLQPFEFIAGIKAGADNHIKAQLDNRTVALKAGEDFIPYSFSSSGNVNGELVLVGFGITASALGYDDYAKVDVKDKVVMVLPFGPEGNNLHGKFGEFLSVRRKALAAREHGAKAILVISEAENLSAARGQEDDNYSDAGIVAVKISKRAADELLKSSGKTMEALQKSGTESGRGETLALAKSTVALKFDLTREMKNTHNVIGWIEGSDSKLKDEFIVIGAHYDHLGLGGRSSLEASREGIHHGADDNASGVAGLLELARVFSANHPRRSIIFAAFSGEEEGLLGSSHYVKNPIFPLANTVAMLNMDMIGRMKNDTLVVGGVGSSTQWKQLVEELNQTRGFVLKLQDDGYGPSDHSSFYGKDIPVLFFFTGVHDDYHKPSDTADRINVISEQAIVSYVQDIVTKVAAQDARPVFVKAQVEGQRRQMNNSFRVYVGSVPEYAENVEGVKLSGVRPGSPAEKAGIKAGDVIVFMAGKNIKNVYDYTYVLQEMQPNQEVDVTVLRDGQKVNLKLTPTPRQ